jgi:hypothetical protein
VIQPNDLSRPSDRDVCEALSEAIGHNVQIQTFTQLGAWSVARCELSTHSPIQYDVTSVIVKWKRPQTRQGECEAIAVEAASLKFLERIGFTAAPAFVAANTARGFLIMEDLGDGVSLSDLIRTRPLEQSLPHRLQFAKALGRMAASSAGKQGELADADSGFMSRDGFPSAKRLDEVSNALVVISELSGTGLTRFVRDDIRDIFDALIQPGPFAAFTNGDVEANNFFVSERQGSKIIDFEAARYTHALTAATWIHVPGPLWISVLDPSASLIEHAFRMELCAGIPQATCDTLYGNGISAACMAMALDRLERFSRLDRREPRDHSRIQLIATLAAAGDVALRQRSFNALAEWIERVAHWLRARWPEARDELPKLVPYAPRIRE